MKYVATNSAEYVFAFNGKMLWTMWAIKPVAGYA